MTDKTNPPDHPVDPLRPASVPFSRPPRPKAPDAGGRKPGSQHPDSRGETDGSDETPS